MKTEVTEKRNYPRKVVYFKEVEIKCARYSRKVPLLDVSCQGAHVIWERQEPTEAPVTITFNANGREETLQAFAVRSNGYTMGLRFEYPVNRNRLV